MQITLKTRKILDFQGFYYVKKGVIIISKYIYNSNHLRG